MISSLPPPACPSLKGALRGEMIMHYVDIYRELQHASQISLVIIFTCPPPVGQWGAPGPFLNKLTIHPHKLAILATQAQLRWSGHQSKLSVLRATFLHCRLYPFCSCSDTCSHVDTATENVFRYSTICFAVSIAAVSACPCNPLPPSICICTAGYHSHCLELHCPKK